jgi:hypothetical protein
MYAPAMTPRMKIFPAGIMAFAVPAVTMFA